MTRYLALATLGLMAFGTDALAQSVASPTIKLQVVISRYEGDRIVSSEPFELRLSLNQTGTVQVAKEIKAVPQSQLLPCVTPASGTQQVGTKVESVVNDAVGEFSVALTITERTLAGCRTIGDREIPVFANRIVAHVVRLKSGDSTEFVTSTDAARNTSTRLTVGLVTEQ